MLINEFFNRFPAEQSCRSHFKADDGKLQRGKGSQKQVPVLVMAESKPVEEVKDNKPNRAVKHIKMTQLPDTNKATINEEIAKDIDQEASVKSDSANCYNDLGEKAKKRQPEVRENKKDTPKVLLWTHIVVANTKRLFLDKHRFIGKEYLQRYLDEFCYKFNRRYFDSVFDRLVVAAVDCSVKTICKLSDSHFK